MSKNDSKTKEDRDEQTAKFLHKIAESGKERGLPNCVVAHYEKKAWEALKTEGTYKSCEQCGMPQQSPLIESAIKFDAELLPESCKNCGKINKKPFPQEPELKKKSYNTEDVKNDIKINSLKRTRQLLATNIQRLTPRKTCRQPPVGLVIPPPILQSKSAKKAKKPKLATEKDPDFLQQLFGIGANAV